MTNSFYAKLLKEDLESQENLLQYTREYQDNIFRRGLFAGMPTNERLRVAQDLHDHIESCKEAIATLRSQIAEVC